MQVVEVRVQDLDIRAEERALGDEDAGALALDVGVVVDLRAVANLDEGLGPRGLEVDVARVELRRGRPAEADVASDAYRTAAKQQDRLVDDPRAGLRSAAQLGDRPPALLRNYSNGGGSVLNGR